MDHLISYAELTKDKRFIEHIKYCQFAHMSILTGGKEILLPYKNRWEKSYRRGVIKKLYQLNTWSKRHKVKFGMLSLTTAQRGYSDVEIIERLSKSWDKFFDNIRKKGYLVFKLFEPHKSGVPHIHALLIGELGDDDIKYMHDLWVKKYKMHDNIYDVDGDQHAFDFSKDTKKIIESVTNYLMKYLSKTIVTDFLNDKSLVRFHSTFWLTKKRMFSCSRYLSRVMGKITITDVVVDKMYIDGRLIYDRFINKSYKKKHQQISIDNLHECVNEYNGLLFKNGFSWEEMITIPDLEINYMENMIIKKNSYHVGYKLLPFEIKSKMERYIDNGD